MVETILVRIHDGSDGDDVSSMVVKQRDDDPGFDVTLDDYERMRSKYFNFNTMMMNGIQNYIHNQM